MCLKSSIQRYKFTFQTFNETKIEHFSNIFPMSRVGSTPSKTRPSREGRSNMGHMGEFSLGFLLVTHVDPCWTYLPCLAGSNRPGEHDLDHGDQCFSESSQNFSPKKLMMPFDRGTPWMNKPIMVRSSISGYFGTKFFSFWPKLKISCIFHFLSKFYKFIFWHLLFELPTQTHTKNASRHVLYIPLGISSMSIIISPSDTRNRFSGHLPKPPSNYCLKKINGGRLI